MSQVRKVGHSEAMKAFISMVGKGQRSGKTLTEAQAESAMQLLLSGHVSEAQKGAFLMLLRVREETPEELAGFVRACRAYTTQLSVKVDFDLGCYAGKRRHLPWMLLAVMCLAQSGKRVLLHGAQEPDSQRFYIADALRQLGFPLAHNEQAVRQHLDTFGFAYADLKWLNSPLSDLLEMRRELGLRSCANSLARMLNPSQASVSVHGVHHRGLDARHAQVAVILNEPNVAVFRGEGGEIEVNPDRAFELYQCREGLQSISTMPALNERWSIKPKQLDCKNMLDVWHGTHGAYYGEAAVIGTLAVMITAESHNTTLPQAVCHAKHMWNIRDLKRPWG